MKPDKMAEAIVELQQSLDAANETIARLDATVTALSERVEELEGEKTNKNGRGPKVERNMTDWDAWRVKFGDLKRPIQHKEAAAKLGLSYGQVFSARHGYTFKHVREISFNADGTENKK